MEVAQKLWKPGAGWSGPAGPAAAQLVLAFGSPQALQNGALFEQLRTWYPAAVIAGCSTAGEILGTQVHDDSLAVTAVRFERSQVDWTAVALPADADGREAAMQVAQALVRPGLRHVLVLCDGLAVNGTTFARVLREQLPEGVCATGGLAADADRFTQTFVCGNGIGHSRQVVGIGFYGDALRVGWGSLGGWDGFGPMRRVTRSQGNVLYELDGVSALDLYKTYLGDHAAGLPGTALLFPLLLTEHADAAAGAARTLQGGTCGSGLVRTVLAVDEAAGSMTFAGDIPTGAQVRLMMANFDHLIEGSSGAADAAVTRLGGADAELAIMISCVGRKLVLRQRVEEEIDAAGEVLGRAALTGFYSYGELCPQGLQGGCELHNQTMTITTFAES